MLTPPKNPLGVTPEAKKQRGTQLVSKAQRRAAALGLLQGGHPFQEVAAAFGVSEATLKAWRRCYEEEGLDGLVDGPRSGRPRKADQRYIDALEVVLTETPDDMGIDDATGWSVAMLCAVMEQKTGMRLGQRQMRQLLRHLGYRYQPAPSLLVFDKVKVIHQARK
jgi:transposase